MIFQWTKPELIQQLQSQFPEGGKITLSRDIIEAVQMGEKKEDIVTKVEASVVEKVRKSDAEDKLEVEEVSDVSLSEPSSAAPTPEVVETKQDEPKPKSPDVSSSEPSSAAPTPEDKKEVIEGQKVKPGVSETESDVTSSEPSSAVPT